MRELHPQDELLRRLLPAQRPVPGVTYVPSRFLLPFEQGGRRYLFHTLTKQCLEAELPREAAAGAGYDPLIAGYFLVPRDKDESAFYGEIAALIRTWRRQKGLLTFTVLPTFRCNARCVYCYEEGFVQTSMTPETVDRTAEFILRHRRGDRVELRWFGGEPLLRPDIIDRICGRLAQAGVEYVSAMTSNGSLITPEIIEKMTGPWRLNRIQISMDGARADYDARKRYCACPDAYDRVMEAVSKLSLAGIATVIRCNVDGENWPRIPEFLADLSAGISHKEHVSLYFSPLNGVRMGEGDLDLWMKILALRPRIEEAGFRPSGIYSLDGRLRSNHCMADGSGVVIAPDGGLYPCEHCPPAARYGDVARGITDPAAREEFCRADRIREKCRRCPFLPQCTGFASCPVQDTHCREVWEAFATDALRRMAAGKKEGTAPDSTC